MIREVNFDGLVGPTHNYGGLSYGNLASTKNKSSLSSPRKAALQGLEKMKYLMDRGFIQGVLPPHERPAIGTLRQLGFDGSDQAILKKAYQIDPVLFLQCSSASAMWAANAAMVSPSMDTKDHTIHLTPANLISNFHRSLEANFTTKILQKIFQNKKYFTVHEPLPSISNFSDEGAANFGRLANAHDQKGIEIFVHGRSCMQNDMTKYPSRQTSEANDGHIRRHQLNSKYCFNIKQNSSVINQGVFHNDVISVANENVFFYHEQAFDSKSEFKILQSKVEEVVGSKLFFINVKSKDLSVKEAVETYLFNSQLITISKGKMLLLCPQECEKSTKVQKVINKILESANPIEEVQYLNLHESMRNGGGPACLRLRVVMTDKELAALSGKVILTTQLYIELVDWVNHYYREKLSPEDLTSYQLFRINRMALEELSQILKLGKIYQFQTDK